MIRRFAFWLCRNDPSSVFDYRGNELSIDELIDIGRECQQIRWALDRQRSER